jgi:hypothetical protein
MFPNCIYCVCPVGPHAQASKESRLTCTFEGDVAQALYFTAILCMHIVLLQSHVIFNYVSIYDAMLLLNSANL